MVRTVDIKSDNCMFLCRKPVYILGQCAYYHVGVVINRRLALTGSRVAVFVEYDPKKNSNLAERFFSIWAPISGKVTVTPLNNFDDVLQIHFDIVETFPMKSEYLPWLLDSVESTQAVQEFMQAKYQVIGNNCRDFAEKIIKDGAKDCESFSIDKLIPLTNLEYLF